MHHGKGKEGDMKRGAEGTGGQWRRNDGSEVEGWIGWGDGMLGVKISGGGDVV
jgi:hypothetical protein